MNKLTAIVLTHNSQDTLDSCLKSVSFADEVIVVDDYSSDNTLRVASKYHAIIFQHKLNGNFSNQRNFAFTKAENEWILFVDSDEIVSSELESEIKRVLSSGKNNYSGYFLKRQDILWGKKLKNGEIGSVKILRLGKKSHGKWKGSVHEEWKIEGKTRELASPLFHYPHQSIGEFLGEINMYTSLRAEELYQKKVPVSWLSIIAYPVGKFLLNYIMRLGFMDGVQGILLAITMSFHSFLVRAKLWQLYDQKKSQNI